MSNWYMILASRNKGGLALMWLRGLDLNVEFLTKWIIHYKIYDVGACQSWFLTCAYGSTYHYNWNELWNNLYEILECMEHAWAIIGDFNAFLLANDKKRGVTT